MATLRDQIESRLGRLNTDYNTFEAQYKELSENILPRRGRFLTTDVNRGDKRFNKIVDNTATLAARTLQAGLMAWHTSPARPWFRLGIPDPYLSKYAPVKEWLYEVERRIRYVFTRSNLYNILPLAYLELGVFATGAFSAIEDDKSFIHFYPHTVGEYRLGLNVRGEVDTCYRKTPYTVGQLVARFGRNKVSSSVKTLYDKGSLDEYVTVLHVVEPNDDRIPSQRDNRNMPWRSLYFEMAEREPLSVSGFMEFPVMAPRWHTNSGDAYGTDCPGMSALGDIKQLQLMQKRKAQAVEKMIKPPLKGPSSLQTRRVSSLPDSMTYVDAMQGQQGLEPLYQVNVNLNDLRFDIQETQTRIDKAFYADLFLMMQAMDRRQVTATEIQERHEEKLLVLGHVLQRLNDEMLDPLIDRTFSILNRQGHIPRPPKELEGANLKVEYISLLSQAQQSVDTRSIQSLLQFVQAAAGVKPDVIDKINWDQSVEEVSERLGSPPTLVNSEDDVSAMRKARADAAEQERAMAFGAAAAQSAKVMGDTDLDQLSKVIGR